MFEGVGGGGFPTALCRTDVGVCYTRGARSRRWCWWWGMRGRGEVGGGRIGAKAWMARKIMR